MSDAARIAYLLQSAEDPLARDGHQVALNLTRMPKQISAMYIYDKTGTDLYERQCNTPEYYLRRAEIALLRQHAADILDICGFPPLVELGSGTALKTRLLIEQYERRTQPCDYFPIDIDAETLFSTAKALVGEFPHLFVNCLAATFQAGLEALPPTHHPRLFLLLGSMLGNFQWPEIRELLSDLRRRCHVGDHVMIGADLHKDPSIIERAYNDSAGYGPRTTLNMLANINRRYQGDFVLDKFRYRSRYDAMLRRNEVQLESLEAQRVQLRALDLVLSFEPAELINAEVMWKFEPDELVALLQETGFASVDRWIDPVYRYGLFLAQAQTESQNSSRTLFRST